MSSDPPIQLVVFSDDWGRHPSSCQHLTRALLLAHDQLDVCWVNTIGTRSVRLSVADAGKVFSKLREMFAGGSPDTSPTVDTPGRLLVISPRMYPGFRSGWQRRFNARQISRAVHAALGPRDGARRVALTTLPITADLVQGKHALDVDRWVYYCVDDFSVWPGSDGAVMDTMERQLVPAVDVCLAVSHNLQVRLQALGLEQPPQLLTHGIDPDRWKEPAPSKPKRGPELVFWGLVDRRLDVAWVAALGRWCEEKGGALRLIGPTQDPDPQLAALPGVSLVGPAKYEDLPGIAARSDVLVMPYADLPVTRAMQPLKFKEYLATGKPVAARDLPSIKAWADAADLVGTEQALVEAVALRVKSGLPREQAQARERLREESWEAKAEVLWDTLVSG